MDFDNLIVVEHPLIKHKLALLRSYTTGPKEFRELVSEMTMLLTYEATRHIPTQKIKIKTPLEETEGEMINDKAVTIVPILRAGLGMLEGILRLLPNASVGHIGIFRDPDSLKPIEYYCKLPPQISHDQIFILDPMLATGGSASMAIDLVKERGGKNITFISIISAPEGVKVMSENHPDVKIYTASLDRKLNDHAYILPGLGDAGDRSYNTL